jgi:hypothetical protein
MLAHYGSAWMTKQDKAKQNLENRKTKKAKLVIEDGVPFLEFKEWSTIADEKAYEKL